MNRRALISLATLMLFSHFWCCQAQQFSTHEVGSPWILWPGQAMWGFTVENRSASNAISAYVVHDIYSNAEPYPYASRIDWDYRLNQNPTNPCSWNLHASARTTNAYIRPTNSSFLSLIIYFSGDYGLRMGTLGNSAVFENYGSVNANPSELVGPVGWQSGPLLGSIGAGATNGVFRLSWTGADGGVFVDFKSNLTNDNWVTIAGPLSGGVYELIQPTNSPNGFFRLHLEQ